jgi:biotin-(acetyl-CoA carboxylase) ligase
LLVAELGPLCARFDAGGFEAVQSDVSAIDALDGSELELLLADGTTASGVARGVGPDGSLVLETAEGRREHRSGLVARVHGGALRESAP